MKTMNYTLNPNGTITLTESMVDELMQSKKPMALPYPVVITPSVAEYILSKYNNKNRALNNGTVASYSKQMREGKWKLNGETISFAINTLGDGQHRLAASVQSDMNFATFLVCGVETDNVTTIDTGKNRSAGDVISFTHPNHHTTLASLIKQCIYMENGTLAEHGASSTRRTAATNDDVNDFFTANENVCESALNIALTSKSYMREGCVNLLTDAELGFALYLLNTKNESFEDVDEFFKGLLKENVERNTLFASTRKVLNSYKTKSNKKKGSKMARIILLAKAYTNYKKGKFDTKVIDVNEDDIKAIKKNFFGTEVA